MPPRKSNTSQSYDAIKFVNLGAQERYTSHLQLKPIQEGGLIQNLEKDVKKTIMDNKWELCDHFDPIVVPVIRKFYANGMERDGFIVLVIGKRLPFDQSTINRYYDLTNLKDDGYQPLVENDGTNWDTIKDFLWKKMLLGKDTKIRIWIVFLAKRWLRLLKFGIISCVRSFYILWTIVMWWNP